jgi:hypothetical protein
MQQSLLRISQVSQLTGKHEDTIRRLIKHLLKTDPQATEKITQEKTVRGFHYLIDEEYILKHVQPLHHPASSKNDVDSKTASNQPLHQSLNKDMQQPLQQGLRQPTYAELKAKDETIAILKKQLEQKDEQISQLLERGRETNVLLKGYQERYLLEAPRGQQAEKKGEETDKVRQSHKQPQKPKPKKVEESKKKGLFSWWR